MRNPPRPLLDRLSDLARGWAVLSDDRGLASADIAEAIAEIESLRGVISDSQRKLERMSQAVTPDRNMAEQIALYLDGQARTLDGSSMEYMQLRRAAEWMRCLNPAPDTQALRDYAVAVADAWDSFVHGFYDQADYDKPTECYGITEQRITRLMRSMDNALAKNPHAVAGDFSTGPSDAAPSGATEDSGSAAAAGTDLRHQSGKKP